MRRGSKGRVMSEYIQDILLGKGKADIQITFVHIIVGGYLVRVAWGKIRHKLSIEKKLPNRFSFICYA